MKVMDNNASEKISPTLSKIPIKNKHKEQELKY